MRRVWLVLFLSFALSALLAPRSASADMICQHRNSKKTVILQACEGKYKLVYDLGSIAQLQAQVSALHASVGGSSGDPASSLTSRVANLESQLLAGAASLAALQARFPVKAGDLAPAAVTRDKVAANAIDGDGVADASLGFADLAFSLIVPYPAGAIGNHWRIVAAHLDMSDGDGDGVSVENQTGASWLGLTSFDASDVSADFAIGADVFDLPPQCVASVTDAGSPSAPDGLEVSVVETGTPPAYFVHARVVGPSRRFDVQGTLLCIGVAKL